MEMMVALLLAVVPTSAPRVANAGFEELNRDSGLPAGWSFTSLPNRPGLVRYEALDDVKAGSRALSIAVAGDHPETTVSYNVHQDVQGFVPGKSYRVSASVRTHGLRTLPMIVVQCLDESGNECLAFSRSPERALTEDIAAGERVETKVTVPEGTKTLRLRIGIPAEGNAGGTALIDDVEIEEIE